MTTLSTIAKTRLEKVAQDNGFDIPMGISNDFLSFKSTHCTLTIWLGLKSEFEFTLFVSDSAVLNVLRDSNPALAINALSPQGASGGFYSSSLNVIFHLVKRAYHLSRSLPNTPLNEYLEATRELPLDTEIERLAVQRIGQNIFREKLFEYWEGKCAITGLSIATLLRASHIKPWSDSTDSERLNVYNGLLLSPSLDLAFDKGLISFSDIGTIILSPTFYSSEAEKIGISSKFHLSTYQPQHEVFMKWHREKIFLLN